MEKAWEIYNGNDKDWNEYILQSHGQFRQLYEWGEYKRKLGWSVLRVIYLKNNQVRSSAQILYRKKHFLCYAYIPGGVNGSLGNISSELIGVIKNYSDSLFIYIRADFIHSDVDENKNLLKVNGWSKPNYSMHNGKFFILNLLNSNQDLLKKAKQKWRYHFNRSQKKGSQFFQENRAEHFIEIEKELSNLRDHRNLFNEREVKPMIDELGSKLIVCISKDINDNLLALRSIILVGDTAWHLSSSVNTRGRDSLSGYSLLMYTIDLCRKRGIKKYNLGGINLERFPGPYRFKLGIAREENLFGTLGEWEYSNPCFMKHFVNFLIKLYLHSSSFLSRYFKNL